MARELSQGVQLSAIGVSFGGPVDAASGSVILSHHVPGWENNPLARRLQGELGAPASVDNDANAAALGEYYFGAGRGSESLFYITVSTGVGGGWILDGRPWRGAQSLAGEIGHTIIEVDGPPCLCGKNGCLERLASGPYLVKDARELLQNENAALIHRDTTGSSGNYGRILLELAGGDPGALSGSMISQAANEGDLLARELVKRSARALGIGIGNAANLVNPKIFVLGGGVTKAGEDYLETVEHYARQTALPQIEFEVLPAALGDDAPLWGGVILAHGCIPGLPPLEAQS